MTGGAAKPSRWTWFYESIWLKIVPRDWHTLGVCAAAAALLTVLFVCIAAQGDALGLPDRAHLRELQGAVKAVTKNKYDVEFQLAPWKTLFEYPSKARALADVAAALREGGEATVLVDGSKFADGEGKFATIFALTVNGKVIRSFAQVEQAWRADNKIFYWLIAFFAPATLALAASALYEYRRSRAG